MLFFAFLHLFCPLFTFLVIAHNDLILFFLILVSIIIFLYIIFRIILCFILLFSIILFFIILFCFILLFLILFFLIQIYFFIFYFTFSLLRIGCHNCVFPFLRSHHWPFGVQVHTGPGSLQECIQRIEENW